MSAEDAAAHHARINIRLGVVTAVMAACTIAVTYYAARLPLTIATRSGAFERGTIEVSIAGFVLEGTRSTSVVIGRPAESDPNALVLGQLPVVLRNTGKRSLRAVTVTFRYPEMTGRELIAPIVSQLYHEGAGLTDSGKVTTSTMGANYLASYTFPTLRPGVQVEILEPILLRDTRWATYFKARPSVFVRSVPGDRFYTLRTGDTGFEMPMDVSVVAEDTERQNFDLLISISSVTGIEELKSVADSEVFTARLRRARQSMTLLKFVWLATLGDLKDSLPLVYEPTEIAFTEDNVKLFSAKPAPMSLGPMEWNPRPLTILQAAKAK